MAGHHNQPAWPAFARHIAGAASPPVGAYDADVVILALDRAEETAAAILSGLSQAGVSRHITIVDQGSSPATLVRLAETVQGREDATLIALDRNLGVPGGRNFAAGMGHGRVIVGLDNDAEFATADTLARMVAAMDEDPDLGALGCRIVVEATGEDDLSSWGYPAALLSRSKETFDAATFVGAGHAIRRETWVDAGGYDERLFFCWEEYDFCLRAIAHSWRLRYRGDIVIRHKVSPERRVAWTGDRWFHFVRNRIYIGRKIGQSWLELSPRMAGYCVKAARNGCLRETPAALWAAVRMAHGAWRIRLPPAARDYLYRTDTAWRGGLLTRLRDEVLSALPGWAPGSRSAAARPAVLVSAGYTGRSIHTAYPAAMADTSIRAMTSGASGPMSAAATHSASS